MMPLLRFLTVSGSIGGVIPVFGIAIAIGGLFVASLAYQGYRRNNSQPMLYLATGIILLTTIPVGVNYALAALTTATDAEILLLITASHLAGVTAILYALTRA